MMLTTLLPFAAAIFSLLLAVLSLVPKKRSPARCWFAAGMSLFALDALVNALTLQAATFQDMLHMLTLGWIVKSATPASWLAFSAVYSRGDFPGYSQTRKIALGLVALLPLALSLTFQQYLVQEIPAQAGEAGIVVLGTAGKAVNAAVLVTLLWILLNLEHTFRAAVGTMRWRMKFVILGLAVIFGTRLYVRSQALLYSVYDPNWFGVESSALLIGNFFLVLAYLRAGFAEVDLYPSQAILRSSLTVFAGGVYLVVVGGLANIVKHFGGTESFQLISILVLLSVAGLAVLLLSDRLRQRLRAFFSRHFKRSQHDSVRIWTEVSRRLGNVKDEAGLCSISAKLVSESFEVLSVAVWLQDRQKDQLRLAASTAPADSAAGHSPDSSPAVAAGLGGMSAPFDMEMLSDTWAAEWRELNPSVFPNGGNRWCLPLRAGETTVGALVLADRVNGASYTAEELQLLGCIADHVTSVLLNLRLAHEVASAREMEAFQTMSAFFVHDLKNAASSLNLMLKNLPVHFDDPEFRQDALRGIGNTARRIDGMIGRLTELRQSPAFKPVEADLNQLVSDVLSSIESMPQVELKKELHPLPAIRADREQIQSVVTNLVLNARDALGPGGRIGVQTELVGTSVVLSVSDNGCGMSDEFINQSLFRPFQTTKNKGIGIGMYQSRRIVEAHGGSIRVESQKGKGSTFRVILPAAVR